MDHSFLCWGGNLGEQFGNTATENCWFSNLGQLAEVVLKVGLAAKFSQHPSAPACYRVFLAGILPPLTYTSPVWGLGCSSPSCPSLYDTISVTWPFSLPFTYLASWLVSWPRLTLLVCGSSLLLPPFSPHMPWIRLTMFPLDSP